MTTTLFAQPYDTSACGFYFETYEQYLERLAKARNDFGQPVEEFEIQFIDGDQIDCELADAFGINQANFSSYLDAVTEWDEERKQRYIIAVGLCGFSHEQVADDPYDEEIDIYYVESVRDLAELFVYEGLYGDIPESLQYYIDYDAIARDLAVEYSETTIAGTAVVYACR